jgi:hypothetical protein
VELVVRVGWNWWLGWVELVVRVGWNWWLGLGGIGG